MNIPWWAYLPKEEQRKIAEVADNLLRRWSQLGEKGHPLLSQEMVNLRRETKEYVREHSDDSS